MEAEMKAASLYNQKALGDTERLLCPRAPQNPCVVSMAVSWEIKLQHLRGIGRFWRVNWQEDHGMTFPGRGIKQKQNHSDGRRQYTHNYVLSRLVVGACWEATWEVRTRELNPVLVVEGLTARGWSEGHSWCRRATCLGAVVCLASCCCHSLSITSYFSRASDSWSINVSGTCPLTAFL